MTWSLALRNLLRNRRRSLATLLAICIGSASILIFGGYSANIKYSMQTAYVRSGGHLQVQHKDYYLYGSGNPTAYGIADYGRLMDAIRGDPVLKDMVKVVTPTLEFGGIAGNFDAGVSRTILGTGVVAADLDRMHQWDEFSLPLDMPHFILDGAAADAAIVGTGLARVLQLCAPLHVPDCAPPAAEVKPPQGRAMPADIAALAQATDSGARAAAPGAHIELLAGQANGTPNVVSLNVLEAEGQGFKEYDDVAVILQLAMAQRLLYGRSAPKVTSIAIQLQRTELIPAAARRLREVLPTIAPAQPLAVLDFETLNPFYVQTIQLFDTIFGFIFALIGAIVLFTVTNTMNTAVVERTVEIGTLRAMGLRRSGIRRMFVIEGVMVGFAGAASGAVLALLLAFVVNRLNLTWLPPGSSEPLPLVLRIWGESGMLLGTTLGLVAIAAASAWWPAHRAARMNVVESLRHV